MSTECLGVPDEPSTSSKVNELKKADGKLDTISRLRALIVTECGLKLTTTENHLKRLQNLRKELNYIQETDWMYESLDKKFR